MAFVLHTYIFDDQQEGWQPEAYCPYGLFTHMNNQHMVCMTWLCSINFEDTKLEPLLPKSHQVQKIFCNCLKWQNREVSKTGPIFTKDRFQTWSLQFLYRMLLYMVSPYSHYNNVKTLTTYFRHSEYSSRLFRSLLSCHTIFCGKSHKYFVLIRWDHV